MATADLLVVGLGNPGAEYAGTRHNLGAETVLLVARRESVSLRPERGTSSATALLRRDGRALVLAVPQTYMNDSGLAVRSLARRYLLDSRGAGTATGTGAGTAGEAGAATAGAGGGGFDPGALVVVHDELDLEPGVVRIKVGGGTAGNNGLRSIQSHLRHLDFTRVRIGIGKPQGRGSGVEHVLRRPGRKDREVFDIAVEMAADAVECIFSEGVPVAMNRFNTRT